MLNELQPIYHFSTFYYLLSQKDSKNHIQIDKKDV